MKTSIFFTQDALPRLVEIVPVVLEKKIFKGVNIFFLCQYLISPWKMMWHLIYEQTKKPLSTCAFMSLHVVCFYWLCDILIRKRSWTNILKIITVTLTSTTMGKIQTEKLNWVFDSDKLIRFMWNCVIQFQIKQSIGHYILSGQE